MRQAVEACASTQAPLGDRDARRMLIAIPLMPLLSLHSPTPA